MKKAIKISGLTISCPKCGNTIHKQYHCKTPTYFCVKCNEFYTLKDKWVEQMKTNTREYKDIVSFFCDEIEDN